MPTSLLILSGPKAVSSARRLRPRKMFRGIKRTLIRKTLAKIKALLASDTREYNRGAALFYTPACVTGYGNDAITDAFLKVKARLEESLVAKEDEL